jgi:hypothetical protein
VVRGEMRERRWSLAAWPQNLRPLLFHAIVILDVQGDPELLSIPR